MEISKDKEIAQAIGKAISNSIDKCFSTLIGKVNNKEVDKELGNK